jgi:hypothetical protein
VAGAVETVAAYIGGDHCLALALFDRRHGKCYGDSYELGVTPVPNRAGAAELAPPIVNEPIPCEAGQEGFGVVGVGRVDERGNGCG